MARIRFSKTHGLEKPQGLFQPYGEPILADGHAIFWTYSDSRTGSLLEALVSGQDGPIITVNQGPNKLPVYLPVYPPFTMTNSPDVLQLEAWGGGPVPPGVSQ